MPPPPSGARSAEYPSGARVNVRLVIANKLGGNEGLLSAYVNH